MNFRKENVTSVLTEFLLRYSPPQNIRNNQKAQQAEAELLLKVLLRYAPESDAGAWANRVLNIVAERSRTRAWPLANEVGAVAKDLRQDNKAPPKQDDKLDSIAINAKRIKNNEAVGDQWLYGKLAWDLIDSGKVTEQMLETYRRGLFFMEKKAVGEDVALKRECDRKAKHVACRTKEYIVRAAE